MTIESIPVIAIDGPSASGKGTIAQLVAAELGFNYLDSGALYRIVAFSALQRKIPWHEESLLAEMIQTLKIKFLNGKVLLNDQDISEEIRTEAISKGASEVAVHPKVRNALIDLQHSFRQAPGLVADGRDMSTVVFPDARTKIFLTATAEVRAKRRYNQLMSKGIYANLDLILQDLRQRDERDQQRTAAPLTISADAKLLETDNLSIEQAVNAVIQYNSSIQT